MTDSDEVTATTDGLKLSTELQSVVDEYNSMEKRLAEMESERDRLRAENKQLREALDTILMIDPAKEDAAFLAVTIAGEALQGAE